MKALLQLGAGVELTDKIGPEEPAMTPLATWILRCEPEEVKILLAHGADPCAAIGEFRAFDLCEKEALDFFGMGGSVHPELQKEVRSIFLLPAKEKFHLNPAIPVPENTNQADTRRL